MRKTLKIFLLGCALASCTGVLPVWASMDMEVDCSVGGISVALNNYFAGSLEPERELAAALSEETVLAYRSQTGAAGVSGGSGTTDHLQLALAETKTEPETKMELETKTEPVLSVSKSANVVQTVAAQQSEYANIAVSQVTGYVNVRSEANTSSAVVGKIYNHCAATILETVSGEGGEWYRIQSGSVNGYIKAQYFVTGAEAEALARSIGTEFATINTDTLRLRESPDLTSTTLTLLAQGAEYIVVGEEGDFYKIEVDADLTGYVAKQYIKTRLTFDEAVSLEEEAAQKADAAQRKQEADAAMAQLEQVKLVEAKKETTETEKTAGTTQTTTAASSGGSGSGGSGTGGTIAANPEGGEDVTVAAPTTKPAATTAAGSATTAGAATTAAQTTAGSPDSSYGPGSGTSTAVVSATRTAIVAYAKQFLGNPYVYGGTSLTNGADCSGFTQGIFSHFGISIGRSSRDQAAKGRAIAVSEVQPGDLLFYASGDYINHVALYIGNNQVIHASNSRTGIIISPYNYRTPYKAATFLD